MIDKLMNIHRTQITYFLLIFLACIATAGCSKPQFVYIHPSPGLDTIKTIAVLPFDNFTKDDKADKKVRSNFVIGFLMTGIFNVRDTSEVDRILKKEGLSYSATQSTAPPAISVPGTEGATAPSVPLSKQIGDALNVEAILVGSVEAYSTERAADQTTPEVSISARLIDTETGIIIWAITRTRRGSGGIPIIGWGKVTSLSVLSQKVIADMVNSLARYAY